MPCRNYKNKRRRQVRLAEGSASYKAGGLQSKKGMRSLRKGWKEKNRINLRFGVAVRVDQILSSFRLNNAKSKIRTKTLGQGRDLGEADKLLCLVRCKRL